MVMNSLYECAVSHCRLKPKRHAFIYQVFMFSVDIDDLPNLAHRIFGFSHNRFNWFSIDDEDHINLLQGGGIRGNLVHWLASEGFDCPTDARIQMVTFPRVLGYGFNPVSFYYLSSKAGEPLAAVAEVVNTFREMKLYWIESLGVDGRWHRRVPKNFYVSPFSDPAMEFDFRLGNTGETWEINIDTVAEGEKILLSSIRGERRDLTSARLVGYLFKYPLLSLKIIVLIHWHALQLWLRRVPFVRKSERREAQLDVMRPHSTLKEHET